jgi:prepilin-type N-terminal cleavage/methylation domain-containing protein
MIDWEKIKKEKKRGLTLAELLVTMGIFSMVMVGINQLFLKSWQNYNLVMHTSEASIAANRGVSEVVNVLRKIKYGSDGSYPILNADEFDLIVFSDIDKDGVVEKVHYYLDGTNFMVGMTKPGGFPTSYAIGDAETKVIITDVANESSQSIFHYYNNQNNPIAAPVANLIDVRMVKVSLWVDRKEGDLAIESYVSLRNLSENDTIE